MGLYWGHSGIVEKKMETIGFRVWAVFSPSSHLFCGIAASGLGNLACNAATF